MCELAVADDARFDVSRIEVDRDGPSYTRRHAARAARESPDDELLLILGGDQAAALATWHEPERGAGAGHAWRSRSASGMVARARSASSSAASRAPSGIEFFDMPRIDISSSLVRARVAAGRPIRYLVPDEVASYIGRARLYARRRAACAAPARRHEHSSTRRRSPSASRRSPRTARRSTSACSTCAGSCRYTDFFVVCSGNTERQTKAIHDAVYKELKDERGPAAAPRRGRARGALDPARLPRLRRCTSSRPRRASSTGWRTCGARRPHVGGLTVTTVTPLATKGL